MEGALPDPHPAGCQRGAAEGRRERETSEPRPGFVSLAAGSLGAMSGPAAGLLVFTAFARPGPVAN